MEGTQCLTADEQRAEVLKRAKAGSFGAAVTATHFPSLPRARKGAERGVGGSLGKHNTAMTGERREELREEDRRIKWEMDVMEAVRRRGGATVVVGPNSSWKWQLGSVVRWRKAAKAEEVRVAQCADGGPKRELKILAGTGVRLSERLEQF